MRVYFYTRLKIKTRSAQGGSSAACADVRYELAISGMLGSLLSIEDDFSLFVFHHFESF